MLLEVFCGSSVIVIVFESNVVLVGIEIENASQKGVEEQ